MDGFVVGWYLWCSGCYIYLICSSSYVFCLVDNFVLYSFICASRSILLIDDEKIPKNPANIIRATLACRFTCVCIAHVL